MSIDNIMAGTLLKFPSPPSPALRIEYRSCPPARVHEIYRGSEHRRHRRTPFDKNVAIWRRDAFGDVGLCPAFGLNISSGGVRIMCLRRLAVGEELGVQLRRDRGVLFARVVWVKPSTDGCIAGICFTGEVLEAPRARVAAASGMC